MKILTGIAIGIIVSLSFPAEAQELAASKRSGIFGWTLGKARDSKITAANST
jgi:hypothetical protein